MQLFNGKKGPTEVEITTKQLSQLSALVQRETKNLNKLRDTIIQTKQSFEEWEKSERNRLNRDIGELKNQVASLESRKKIALEPIEERESELSEREANAQEKEQELKDTSNKVRAQKAYLTKKEKELRKLEQELTVEGEHINSRKKELKQDEEASLERIRSAQEALQEQFSANMKLYSSLQEKEREIALRENTIAAQQKNFENIHTKLEERKQELDKRANKLRKQHEQYVKNRRK